MKHRKTFILVICLVSLVFVSATALADIVVPYASELIKTTSVTCTKNASGTITATAKITTNGIIEKLGFVSIQIQEKSGSSWITVKSAADKYKTNGSLYSYSIQYTGTSGREYRAYASFYAENAGVSDSRTGTSSSVVVD